MDSRNQMVDLILAHQPSSETLSPYADGETPILDTAWCGTHFEEIHIEIVSQNSSSDITPTQIKCISSLREYFEITLNSKNLSVPKQQRCCLCSKEFLSFKALYEHAHILHTDTAGPPLECFICQLHFVFQETYLNHLLSDHKIRNPEMICSICLVKLADRTTFQQHMLHHQADQICKNCSTKFYNIQQLNLHFKYHSCIRKQISCEICAVSFGSRYVQGLHSLRHKQIECPLHLTEKCKHFSSEVELVSHLRDDHSKEDRSDFMKIVEKYDSEEKYLDELITKLNSNNDCRLSWDCQNLGLELWLSGVKLQQNIECSACTSKLSTLPQLWIHFLEKHLNTKKCLVCHLEFKDTISLLTHFGSKNCKSMQVEYHPLKCSQCELSFTKEDDLLVHQLSHIKPLQCSKCRAEFSKKSDFKQHLMKHRLPAKSIKAMFECTVCSSKWSTMSKLRRHIRSHSNDRQYQCELCGSTFKRHQALIAHKTNVHSTESPECAHCGNKCRNKQALFFHICRVHVHLRRFVCGLCGKRWPQNQDLRRHLGNAHNTRFPPLNKSMGTNEIHVIPSLDNLNPDDPVRRKIELAVAEEKEKLRSVQSGFTSSTITAEPTKPQDNAEIFFSCDSCSFRCKDLNEWLKHTIEHQRAENPVELLAVPILPVQTFLLSPVVPVVNYIPTIVTVSPNTQEISINPITDSNPASSSQVLPRNFLNVDFLSHQSSTGGDVTGLEKIDETPCENSVNAAEVIDMNGMVVQIQRLEKDSSNLIVSSKPDISVSNDEDVPGEIAGENSASEIIDSEECDLITTGNENDMQNEAIGNDVSSTNRGAQISLDLESEKNTSESAVHESSKQNGPWQCSQCGKILKSSKSSERHLRTHEGVKPFSCATCGKAFLQKHNLNIHMRTHTQERPYTCPICDKTIRYHKDYIDHKKKHEGIKDHTCSDCGRAFVRQRELLRHQQLMHSPEKKFQCPICLKNFRRLDYLKQVHIPQAHGQLCCTICKKRFEKAEELKEHQRKHSEKVADDKKYMCPVCDRSFASQSALKPHLELHNRRKTYVVCSSCPRKFCSTATMLTHLTNFHKKWKNVQKLSEERLKDAEDSSHQYELDVETDQNCSHQDIGEQKCAA